MARYLTMRLLRGAASFLCLILVVFCMTRLVGDPTATLLPQEATREEAAELFARYGLDRPLVEQFARFLINFLQGDLGRALYWNVPVTTLIGERLPASLELASTALLLSLAIGIPVGVQAAVRCNGAFDYLARSLAILGGSMPTFWIGILLINLLAIEWKLFPTGGRDQASSLALPAITLGWAVSAMFVRLVRSSMLEVLGTDYIKLARIKGVPERRIVWGHALRNALLPTVTYASVVFATLLGSAVVTETVFAWPGLGRLLVEAVRFRDIPVLQGVVIVLGGAFILAGLIADLVYLLLNPKLRVR